jgi:hypothetical protein
MLVLLIAVCTRSCVLRDDFGCSSSCRDLGIRRHASLPVGHFLRVSAQSGVVTSNAVWRADVYLYGGYNGSTGPVGPVGPVGPAPSTKQFYVLTGNAFNQTAAIGTTDAFPLAVVTNNQTRLTFGATGGINLPLGQTVQFRDAQGNTATIVAPPALASSYTIRLPTNVPPSSESMLVADTTGATWWQPVLPPYLQISLANTVTSTSTTLVQIPDTVLTVGTSGVYQISLSAVVQHSSTSNAAAITMQIYINTSPVATGIATVNAMTPAFTTVVGGAAVSISGILPGLQAGQTLSVYWQARQTGTISCFSRTFSAVRLGPG